MSKCNLFHPDRFNILSDLFAHACGADPKGLGDGNESDKQKFYEFVSKTPYASLIVKLGDALKDMGYEIVEKDR